jgi:hypothetical protein
MDDRLIGQQARMIQSDEERKAQIHAMYQALFQQLFIGVYPQVIAARPDSTEQEMADEAERLTQLGMTKLGFRVGTKEGGQA